LEIVVIRHVKLLLLDMCCQWIS